MMTEPRFVGDGACRSSFAETEESDEDSEDSESASLRFLSGRLLSLIMEMVGEGGDGDDVASGGAASGPGDGCVGVRMRRNSSVIITRETL